MSPVSSPTAPSSAWPSKALILDQDVFTQQFDRYPFKIAHTLSTHPLLQLPRLVKLAQDRGGEALYFRGDHNINQVDDAAGDKRTFLDRQLARPQLSAEETLAQIESCNAWMQLRHVGADPEYAALLAQIIEEFRPFAEQVSPGMDTPRADIFVSSPGATTPFHLDEEHNFLLQIRGTKRMAVVDGFNPAVVGPNALTDFYQGNGELASYSERLEQHSIHVDLVPGEGVHVPPCHPHWVQNGNAVSISLGILWLSDVTARRRHLYRVKRLLAPTGLRFPEPGQAPVLDAALALPVTIKRKLRRAFGG